MTGWSGALGLALFSTLLAITAFLAGLRRIGAVQASTLSTLEAVTTVIVGAAFLGDAFKPIQILGGALILIAAVMIARTQRLRARNHLTHRQPSEDDHGSHAD